MGRNRHKRKQRHQPSSPRQIDLEEAIAMQPAMTASKQPQKLLEPVLLTVHQVGQLLNLSRSTVDRLAAAGKLPGHMKIGGQVRYHLPTLLAWLQDQAAENSEGLGESDPKPSDPGGGGLVRPAPGP